MPHRIVAAVVVSLSVAAHAQPLSTPDPASAWEEIAELVRTRFRDPDLNGLDWPALTRDTARAIDLEPGRAPEIIRATLARLDDRHTNYFLPTERKYYELLDVFNSGGVEDHPFLPDGLVTYVGIGLVAEEIDGRLFAADVYPGGPAHDAGVLVGDELVGAVNGPFADIEPFLGMEGRAVPLMVRRRAGGPVLGLTVVPERIQPRALFLEAQRLERRLIERDGVRVGYVRGRSHAHPDYLEVFEESMQTVLQDADALVFDFRGGWGGGSMDYLTHFNPAYPEMTTIRRDGERRSWRPGWSRPLVGLADGGSRSSKDILAHALKKLPNAVLVGGRTAGAVTGGSLFVLSDGSALYLGVIDLLVDGVRLEGVGVEPDIAVGRSIPYAAGADPQVERAIEVAERLVRERRGDV
ncbi:MAG: S41 family peptidase [Planctomycetota bacterium]